MSLRMPTCELVGSGCLRGRCQRAKRAAAAADAARKSNCSLGNNSLGALKIGGANETNWPQRLNWRQSSGREPAFIEGGFVYCLLFLVGRATLSAGRPAGVISGRLIDIGDLQLASCNSLERQVSAGCCTCCCCCRCRCCRRRRATTIEGDSLLANR